MITVREIDPAETELFDSWYAVLRAGATADREAAIVISHDAMAYALRTPSQRKTQLAVGAFEASQVVGAMLFEYRLEGSQDSVEVEIDVPPAEPPSGDRDSAVGLGQIPCGRRARPDHLPVRARRAGGVHHRDLARQHLRGRARLHRRAHRGPPRRTAAVRRDAAATVETAANGYELTSWAGPCPEEYLQAYADLRTAMDQDVPTGGMTTRPGALDVDKLRASAGAGRPRTTSPRDHGAHERRAPGGLHGDLRCPGPTPTRPSRTTPSYCGTIAATTSAPT